MNEWHGYPQHPDAHPERPWWRRMSSGLGWERVDNRALTRDNQALPVMDAMNPMSAPPPRCGQVWVWDGNGEYRTIADGTEAMVVGVQMGRPVWPASHPNQAGWPPSGAVLVAGPFSPWQPPETP